MVKFTSFDSIVLIMYFILLSGEILGFW